MKRLLWLIFTLAVYAGIFFGTIYIVLHPMLVLNFLFVAFFTIFFITGIFATTLDDVRMPDFLRKILYKKH
ncbi:MAG: hypothetical protein J0H55_08425 [Chitinophagaceae bacterium]|nr:hypothetical protein [Chitinophagaceae bacterium]